MNNKLQAKDLINIGIFTAIYFVVFFRHRNGWLYSRNDVSHALSLPFYVRYPADAFFNQSP